MKIFYYLLVLICLTSFPADAQAAVISRDWQTPGDGLLTYDTINKREWLDLTQTLLINFEHFVYEDVLPELEPGGMFAGFQTASLTDVRALAQSAGITTSQDFATNKVPTGMLIDLLGPTFGRPVSDGSRFSLAVGLLEETDMGSFGTRHLIAEIVYIAPPEGSSTNARAGVAFAFTSDIARVPSTGVFLYREIVPEPSSFLMTILLAVILSMRCHMRPFREPLP